MRRSSYRRAPGRRRGWLGEYERTRPGADPIGDGAAVALPNPHVQAGEAQETVEHGIAGDADDDPDTGCESQEMLESRRQS